MVEVCYDENYVDGLEAFCAVRYNGERFKLGQGVTIRKKDGEIIKGGILHIGKEWMLVITEKNPLAYVIIKDIESME